MRLALQALFLAPEADEDGAARRALLERRLRASERSAGFFRRLRGVVDDDSLRAPEIFAEESFPDANVVAEYLDSQTSAEIARDYEDVCWDSPEALAEIGRCYDILNNDALNCVVVPKNCRRRLYYIAWEENNVNLAPKGESASVLTGLTPDDSSREADEQKSDGERVPTKTRKRREKKPEKTSKSSETVGTTLAAERSLWRRVKRWTARTTLALGLGGAICCGWQTLNDDKRSETFQLATPQTELVDANIAAETSNDEEGPLRPTVVSGGESDELSAASLPDASISVAENDAFNDYSVLNPETEPPKVAVLPDTSSELGGGRTPLTEAANAEGSGFGLSGDEPWARRPSIEIPAQNNDVFSKTKRY